jgi:crossover junction endodeoxyribonuclease RuvC
LPHCDAGVNEEDKTVSETIRILGIDPGSQITGLGVVESDGRNSHYLSHTTIVLGKLALPEKLAAIHHQITDIIQEWQPQEAAIEEVFISRNAASALKLGQARGAAIAACMVSRVPVYEYAARTVKQAVVGTGAAAKQQVQHMAKTLLSIRGRLPEDAADALAIALCHAHNRLHRYNDVIATRRSTRRRY